MGTDDDTASKAYADAVTGIIDDEARASTYRPPVEVELFVRNRREPASVAELDDAERRQLAKMFPGADLDAVLRDGTEDGPLGLEVATVFDATDVPRYTLWGWDYGVVYLLVAGTLDCVAFAAQHDLEHWHADQRPLFWAMARAMRRAAHGVRQPMKFCWWIQKCWDEIADLPRGTVQSEPYIRRQFAGEN